LFLKSAAFRFPEEQAAEFESQTLRYLLLSTRERENPPWRLGEGLLLVAKHLAPFRRRSGLLGDAVGYGAPPRKTASRVFATFAKLERERLIERTKAGLWRAKAEGKILGRRKLVIDRQRIVELRKAGLTVLQIAGEMGCSVGFVHKTLSGWTPLALETKAAVVTV
jgi:hypothetical protein